MAEPERRRRRRRRPSPDPARPSGEQVAGTPAVRDPDPQPGPGSPGADREAERGLRGLVGSGSSQVSISAALRARDAARPGPRDLAAAEEDLVIVRRGWVPRADLPPDR